MNIVKKWFTDQYVSAKAAWTIIVVVAALLGYDASIEKQQPTINEIEISQKLDIILDALGVPTYPTAIPYPFSNNPC